jgi:Domain of unknown function (DUF4412)
MRPAVMLALAALAVPGVASADFEGVLDAKISGRMTGTVRTWISKDGLRSETELHPPDAAQANAGKTIRSITIVKVVEPGRTYILDEARKTYFVVESKGEESEPDAGDDAYVVKRIGRDTVAGYACERVDVTSKHGSESELCIAADFFGNDAWYRLFQLRERGKPTGLHKALLDAGVKGLPIRWQRKSKSDEDAFTMELVSAKKQRVPASTFEIPAGYTKRESVMPAMSPESAAKLDEAMKNMTPEQRKKMEELMKRMKGGQ